MFHTITLPLVPLTLLTLAFCSGLWALDSAHTGQWVQFALAITLVAVLVLVLIHYCRRLITQWK